MSTFGHYTTRYLKVLCVVAMGDFNSDLGNSLGNRGTVNSNQRGVKLLDSANYFNL